MTNKIPPMMNTTIHSYGSFILKKALMTGEKKIIETKIANISSLIHVVSSVDSNNTAPVKIPSRIINIIFERLSIFYLTLPILQM